MMMLKGSQGAAMMTEHVRGCQSFNDEFHHEFSHQILRWPTLTRWASCITTGDSPDSDEGMKT